MFMYTWLVYFLFFANYLIIMILVLWLFIFWENSDLHHDSDFE